MKNIVLTIGFLCGTYHNSFVDDGDGSEKQPNHQNTRINVKRELEKCGANRFDGIEQPHTLIACERGYRTTTTTTTNRSEYLQATGEKKNNNTPKTSLNGSVVGANCCKFKESKFLAQRKKKKNHQKK